MGNDKYFNTTNLEGSELKQEIANAKSQGQKILTYMKAHPDIAFSPFSIQKAVLKNSPITSVRRAMTVLAADLMSGVIKTSQSEIGDYGKKNYKWMFSSGLKSFSEAIDYAAHI